jgi:hypothetical protein
MVVRFRQYYWRYSSKQRIEGAWSGRREGSRLEMDAPGQRQANLAGEARSSNTVHGRADESLGAESTFEARLKLVVGFSGESDERADTCHTSRWCRT